MSKELLIQAGDLEDWVPGSLTKDEPAPVPALADPTEVDRCSLDVNALVGGTGIGQLYSGLDADSLKTQYLFEPERPAAEVLAEMRSIAAACEGVSLEDKSPDGSMAPRTFSVAQLPTLGDESIAMKSTIPTSSRGVPFTNVTTYVLGRSGDLLVGIDKSESLPYAAPPKLDPGAIIAAANARLAGT